MNPRFLEMMGPGQKPTELGWYVIKAIDRDGELEICLLDGPFLGEIRVCTIGLGDFDLGYKLEDVTFVARIHLETIAVTQEAETVPGNDRRPA